MAFVPRYIEINKITEADVKAARIPTKETQIIPYKDWKKESKPSEVFKLPIQYCKFRVDNGRIAGRVTAYETSKGPLDPNAETTQQILSEFLTGSDSANNEILKKAISRDGQREAAVITADGFLINGNRRKWALEQLNKKNPSEQYKSLKVVILPGSDNPERPTISDIALMENDFQLYSDGRSEYSSLNKTLTLFKNVQKGIELEEMLRQDPSYTGLNDKEFKRKVQQYKKKYLRPIELINEYLKMNKVKNEFVRVEDKWTAFQDMSERVMDPIENERGLIKHKIDENEIGLIKSAAFNIIKLRDHEAVDQRTHKLISRMLKWVEVDKKEVLKIGKIEDPYENITDPDERLDKWNDEFNDRIINSIKKLDALSERKKDQEGPINRLEDILQKLNHEELEYEQLTFMKPTDAPEALKLANSIQTSINRLVKLFFTIKTGKKENLASLIEQWNGDKDK